MTNIFVGNLSFDTTDADLHSTFGALWLCSDDLGARFALPASLNVGYFESPLSRRLDLWRVLVGYLI